MRDNNYIKKNRAVLSIPKSLGIWLLLFFSVRLLLIIITSVTGASPFLCYDDCFSYDKVTSLSNARIANWLDFRNCYYIICMYLNKFRIGQYITATRILNVILYYFLCFKIHKISKIFDYDSGAAKAILIFMLVDPYYVFFSMVPLREVICASCVFHLFWVFFRYEKEKKINWITTILTAVLLYFTRVYILEVLLFLLLAYKLKNSHLAVKISLAVLAAGAVAYFFYSNSSTYLYVLNDKIESYVYNGSMSAGMLSKIEVTGLHNIYNLIFLLPYVQLLPLPGAYDIYYTGNSWSAWITAFSGVAGFVLPYFWMHIYEVFRNKDKRLERLLALFYLIFVIIIAVTEPGNSRFFFFTTPIFYLFGINEFVKKMRKNPRNILYGCICACVPYFYLLL